MVAARQRVKSGLMLAGVVVVVVEMKTDDDNDNFNPKNIPSALDILPPAGLPPRR